METSTKVFIGIGSLLAIGFLTKDSWMKAKASPDSGNNTLYPSANIGLGNATDSQFDTLVALAQSKGSTNFTNASAEQLINMRKTFTSNLTSAEAQELMVLVEKSNTNWVPSEKIRYSELLKKWTGAPIPSIPNVVAKPILQVAPTKVIDSSEPYNILKDADYSKKTDILSKWYDYIKDDNKKRFIKRIIPQKNDFVLKFLPMKLDDLKQYSDLIMKGEKNRDTREEFILENIRAKYPVAFKGRIVLYSFDGNADNLQLSNI